MINPLLMKDEMCKLVREIKIQDHKQVLWKNVVSCFFSVKNV